jgi:acetoin utilization deacetylase AcuC-like enzyme
MNTFVHFLRLVQYCHFLFYDFIYMNDYEIVALEKNCGDNSYRETIEKLWMNKLRTFKPHGLNTKT